MGKKPAVIYYYDESADEFAGDHITPRPIGGDYRYLRRSLTARFLHLFWYHLIAIPAAYVGMKLYFSHRVVGREKLAAVRGGGFFLYGNHTHNIADAVIPTLVSRPVDVSVIVHPNNVSMPILGRITPYLGALPLPDGLPAMRNFKLALDEKMRRGQGIAIYPEAHIWPYYTAIRPYPADSFSYPVRYGVPAFAVTNTYQKRKHRKTPRVVTYIDGPFLPDTNQSPAEQRRQLHAAVMAAMKMRAKENNVTVIRYEKAVDNEGERP